MTKVMTVLFALLAPITGWTDDHTPTQQALLVHPAYTDFSKMTSGMRENVNTTQVLVIKSFPRQQ